MVHVSFSGVLLLACTSASAHLEVRRLLFFFLFFFLRVDRTLFVVCVVWKL